MMSNTSILVHVLYSVAREVILNNGITIQLNVTIACFAENLKTGETEL